MSEAAAPIINFDYFRLKNMFQFASSPTKPTALQSQMMVERVIGLSLRAASTPCKGCAGEKTCPTYMAVYNHLESSGIENSAHLAHILTGFSRCITSHARRNLQVLSMFSLGLSQDECAAVSLIAACQYNDNAAAKSFASVLLKNEQGIGCILRNAHATADSFIQHGVRLSLQTIENGFSVLRPPEGTC